MNERYISFLVRCFRPGVSPTTHWKISLQNTRSLQIVQFDSLLELYEYLKILLEEVSNPSGADPDRKSGPGSS
jgi:hypothetical protein